MEIKNAVFVKGSPSVDGVFEDGLSQIAFIGRSNVGKSSTINALTKTKGLAKTSGAPGATKHINMFLVNNKFYIVDLPGYGYVKGSVSRRDTLHNLIEDYLTYPFEGRQTIVLIIDGKVGPTTDDLDILQMLEEYGKSVVVAVNKIDRLKSAELKNQLIKIQKLIGGHKVLPYSAEKKNGIGELWAEITK
ncbi:MAG: ribosome biogenesis GTP-binding protein YsxC [Candidatus Pacebacteria bacterium]|nr:ribosome biogenesis GTP-binding protein YsxC [Candidatus Paceibacterota bacterium]